MTNYEKIKNMTIEEMAEWLDAHTTKCDICVYDEQSKCLETCFYGIKKWLEREADEE